MTTLSYLLDVIPLTQLPLARSPRFTYKSSVVVPFGSLVSVPFGSQTIEGISLTCTPKPSRAPQWVKGIHEIIQPDLMTEKQITLAESISATYFTPLGRVLRHAIPKKAKKLIEIPSDEATLTTPILSVPEKKSLEKFLTSKKPGFLTSENDRHTIVFALTKELAQKNKQTLILVPEILHLLPLEEEAHLYFASSDIAVLHSHLTPREYATHWTRIQNGDAKIILSTRQGLFAPFKNLGAVVVTEEQDQGYKQWDMSPRYQGRAVATTLASLHKACLLYTSGASSLESAEEIQQKTLLHLNPTKKSEATPLGKNINLINLRLERFRKNFSPISEELREHLSQSLTRGEQSILLIPQRGVAAYSVCAGCKKIFRCTKSGHALREERNGSYSCPGCDYKTSLFPSCPECGHLSFWARGIGSERIEQELKRLFPYTKTARFDGETIRKHKDLKTLYQDVQNGKIGILIGTHMLQKRLPLPKPGLVAIIDADNLLSGTDFRGDERFLQTIAQLKKDSRPVFIQTFEPEHRLFRQMTETSYEDFLARLLKDRETLKYPPYANLYALTPIVEAAKRKTKTLSWEKLQEQFPALQVHQAPPKKNPQANQTTLFLKIPLPLPADFLLHLKTKAAEYHIDPDPLHFS
ncbi:MAG: primosomal protein N' [Candidatus Moranbacteria bacterium]|nr:primosomal protein N' [Candidatus Moranbacteria bacterium]